MEAVNKCGLCGKSERLTTTECCNRFICDDLDQYVVFSFERNSCYRNHDNYTVCSFHNHYKHVGRWQDCIQCQNEIGLEMYVYNGTHEYNFEKLENPPSYEPTKCIKCSRTIVLSTDTYRMAKEGHICDMCEQIIIPTFFGSPANFSPIENRDMQQKIVIKIGRNEPCPCKSGKKYKKCCLEKYELTGLQVNEYEFIKNILTAKKEAEAGKLKTYRFDEK